MVRPWKPPASSIVPPSRELTTAVRTKRANEAKAASKRPMREPVSVDAPPLSSSEDEEDDYDKGQASRKARELSDDISDSSNDRSRGHIQSTTFKRPGDKGGSDSLKPAKQRQHNKLLVADDMRKSRVGHGGSAGSGVSEGESGKRGTKRPRPDEESPEKPGKPTTTKYGGGSVTTYGRSRLAPKATYGGRSRLGMPSIRSTSSTSTTTTKTVSARPKATFKTFVDDASDLSEPEEKEAAKKSAPPTKTSRKQFVPPPSLSPERAKTPPKFKSNSKWARSDDDEEYDEDKSRAKKGSAIAGKENDKPQSKTRAAFKPPPEDDSEDEPGDNASKHEKSKAFTSTYANTSANSKAKTAGSDEPMNKKDLFRSRQKWRSRKESDKGSTPSSSQSAAQPAPRAVFKVPEYNESFPAGGDSTVLDISDDGFDKKNDRDNKSDDEVVSVAASDNTMEYKGPAICPLCKESLDEATLRDLLPNHYLLSGISYARIAKTRSVIPLNLLKFDEKMRFCNGHKHRASRLAWVARGYPAIDWDALPARLARHEKHIHRILAGKTVSTFRTAWEKVTAPTTTATIVIPGYYGRRGLRVLSDAIVHRHASTLRKLVVKDQFLAARGMAQFVQAVLVPELAIQLIREDMQKGGAGASSFEDAQRIMEQSAEIGEEVMDEVWDGDEDEDERSEDDDEDEVGGSADDGYDSMAT